MNATIVRRLARAQAPLRLEELTRNIITLQEERNAILAEFSDLAPATDREPNAPKRQKRKARRALATSIDPELVLASPRPKRTMSKALRKAVSIRMTKYWAARRKAKR